MAVEWIAWAINQKTGSATNKAVLMAICNHANGNGYCWPSQKEIQQFTELSLRSIQRAMQELEKLGLIQREERRRVDGTRSSDAYILQGDTQLPDRESYSQETAENSQSDQCDRETQGDTESPYQGDSVSFIKATECQGNILPSVISEPSPSETVPSEPAAPGSATGEASALELVPPRPTASSGGPAPESRTRAPATGGGRCRRRWRNR